MELNVNGKPTECNDGATVADLLAQLNIANDATGVAVALNESVIARTRWSETVLSRGDEVEIIHAVQGG
jgi:sulfur carrier protein